MQHSIQYGTETIDFDVVYRDRKTMEIQVKPPGKVTAIVPKGTAQAVIYEVLVGKAGWIKQKQALFKDVKYQSLSRRFENGESFMYLGKNYCLQLHMVPELSEPLVRLYQGKFVIQTATNNQAALRGAMEKWYRAKAFDKFTERVKYYQRYFSHEPRQIKISNPKKRWASCSSQGHLLFNWRCVMAPESVVDCIVVHEMSHLVHLNHSPDFWGLVRSIVPDYDKGKEWLRVYGIGMDI